jgi:hypothetical protein
MYVMVGERKNERVTAFNTFVSNIVKAELSIDSRNHDKKVPRRTPPSVSMKVS